MKGFYRLIPFPFTWENFIYTVLSPTLENSLAPINYFKRRGLVNTETNMTIILLAADNENY